MELRFYKNYITALQKFTVASQEFIYLKRTNENKPQVTESLKKVKKQATKLYEEIKLLPKNMREPSLIKKIETALNMKEPD